MVTVRFATYLYRRTEKCYVRMTDNRNVLTIFGHRDNFLITTCYIHFKGQWVEQAQQILILWHFGLVKGTSVVHIV